MNPEITRQWRRFRRHRRGFWSFIFIGVLFVLSLGSEFLCNNRPILVRWQGNTYFPVFKFYSGQLFGMDDLSEPDYAKWTQSEEFKRNEGFVLYPLYRHGPYESMEALPESSPSHPTRTNLFGTDDRGRDLGARLLYGFRSSMLFALISWLFIVMLSFVTGAIQGYEAGRIDFYGQRLTEIWSALPFLYVAVFLLSLFPAGLLLLTVIWVAFNWMGLSSYIRAEVLRIRKMDYVTASRALGSTTARTVFRHVLPNSLTPILTFSPFIISASVGGLAALDYLGLGLPPPTASWGELLHQGKENLHSWWLVFFPFTSLFLTLLGLNFIGEAVRSAMDAREVIL